MHKRARDLPPAGGGWREDVAKGGGTDLESQVMMLEAVQGESNAEYEAFVDKFKPKLTTDDCYTPPMVYDAVAEWVAQTYGLDRASFVRPFYPGGDYEHYPYEDGAVVVDNPPFSILAQIIATYCRREIPFFLFCPGVVGLRKDIDRMPVTILAAGAAIVYQNGASVNTSFITNLESDYIVRSCPQLTRDVEDASKKEQAKIRKTVPKYKYPAHVVTLAQINYLSQHDTEYGVRRGEAVRIGCMDAQRQAGKACFGGGLLVSEKAAAEKAAAEKAAAEKAAAEKAAATVWNLSAREWAIVRSLGMQQAK